MNDFVFALQLLGTLFIRLCGPMIVVVAGLYVAGLLTGFCYWATHAEYRQTLRNKKKVQVNG